VSVRHAVRALLASALALAALATQAHKPSDSYLTLTVPAAPTEGAPLAVQGRWDIALRDLDLAIGLDTDADGQLTWGEVRAHHAEIARHALARLALRRGGQPCTATAGEQLVDEHTDGTYTVLPLAFECPAAPAAASLEVEYRLFAELDPMHRGLLRRVGPPAGPGTELPTRSALFGPQEPVQAFDLGRAGAGAVAGWRAFVDYAREGVWHIWIGFDHILFLVSLLLPAVFVWRGGAWQPASRTGEAALDVLRVVTAFTVAHSLTLSAATLGWLRPPSRWVESAIALSVVLAALNNLRPLVHGRRWAVAFGFGLVHGFGFASVLADLGLPPGALALSLLGFNVGVELGQLAIVALLLPPAFLLRRTRLYRRGVFVGGSIVIALLATAWLVERAFDLKLF
jgi:hypothetical protein